MLLNLPVLYLTKSQFALLSVREFGLPTGLYVGKIWIYTDLNKMALTSCGDLSLVHWVATCVVPSDKPSNVKLEKRRIVVEENPREEIPEKWSVSMAEYCREWPCSADTQAFLTRHLRKEERESIITSLSTSDYEPEDDDDRKEMLEIVDRRQWLWRGSHVELTNG